MSFIYKHFLRHIIPYIHY